MPNPSLCPDPRQRLEKGAEDLAETPWSHQNWDTNPLGSSTRLTELRAHLSEVRLSFQRAVFGSHNTANKSHSRDADSLQRYIHDLEKKLETEEVVPGATSTATGVSFVRMRPTRE